MKAIRKIMASNGEYQKDGETKKRWIRVGTLFKGDDGQLSQKLDVIPVGPEWSGWFNLYPLDEPGQQQGQQAQQPSDPRMNQQPQQGVQQGQDADIPF